MSKTRVSQMAPRHLEDLTELSSAVAVHESVTQRTPEVTGACTRRLTLKLDMFRFYVRIGRASEYLGVITSMTSYGAVGLQR